MGISNSTKIVLLILVNILWGIIPLPAAQLFDTYSIFIILFVRFLSMAISGLIILTWIFINQKKKKQINLAKLLTIYLKSKNSEFFSLNQWTYLFLVAVFGFNVMLMLFFWGIDKIGIVIISIGFILSLVLTTIINWGRGKEEMSSFKILYLSTLIFATIILGIQSQANENTVIDSYNFEALGIVIAYAISLTFFIVTGETDRISKLEWKAARNFGNYPILRLVMKLTIMSLFAGITLPISLGLFQILSPSSALGVEAAQFFTDFSAFGKILSNGNTLILILVCTLIPYSIYYFLAGVWDKNSSFDMWAGIIQIIEPIINIFIGISFLDEYFPTSWLIVVNFLLVIGITTRYLAENNAQIIGIVLIKLESGNLEKAMNFLFPKKQILSVSSLCGQYDIKCDFRLTSQKALYSFTQKVLNQIPGKIHVKLVFITKKFESKEKSE